MKILPEPLSFEWDKGNLDKNYKKHRVINKETEEVFINKPPLVWADKKHSKIETRFQALGKTNEGKLLFISFTIRDNKVRIVSARPMSRKERRIYEEKTKTHS